MITIDICMICSNCEYIRYINKQFNYISQKYKDYDINFIFLEYNSTDKTKYELELFLKKHKGRLISRNIGIKTKYNIKKHLKDAVGKLSSKYTMWIDTGYIFLPNIIDRFINSIEYNNNVVLVSGFEFDVEYYKKTKEFHYINTKYLSTKYYNNYNRDGLCLFTSCNKCKKKTTLNKIFLCNVKKNIYPITMSCSICFIKTDVYNNINWGKSEYGEHLFCLHAQSYGKLLLDSKIKYCKESNKFIQSIKLLNNI